MSTDASDPLPFANYEGGGRQPLGDPNGRAPRPRTGAARTGYGLPPARYSDGRCSYCGTDLSSTYEGWLQLSLDHVVPLGLRQSPGIDPAWLGDLANCVVCCRACNEFLNQYRAPRMAGTWEEFIELRDEVFRDKRLKVLQRHATERDTWARLQAEGWLGSARGT